MIIYLCLGQLRKSTEQLLPHFLTNQPTIELSFSGALGDFRLGHHPEQPGTPQQGGGVHVEEKVDCLLVRETVKPGHSHQS